jgi:hypothetical protein
MEEKGFNHLSPKYSVGTKDIGEYFKALIGK